MDFINEYALLVAVALPVVAVVGLQVFLFVTGERGTGLIPGFGRYPSIELRKRDAEIVEMPAAYNADLVGEPSNDEMERKAA